MMMEITLTTTTCILIVAPLVLLWGWKLLNWIWLRPKRHEKLLRAQGLQGTPYKLLVGDSKEMIKMMIENAKTPIYTNSLLDDKDVTPHVFTFIHHIFHKYGNNSFLWEGTNAKVIITNPEHIKEIFNNMHDFIKPQLSPLFKLLGTGLANYEGEKWRMHRKIINPAFYSEKLKIMSPIFFQCCDEITSKWGEEMSNGKFEIDAWPFVKTLTCDVISRTAFGSNYEEGQKIFDLLNEQATLIMKFYNFFIPGWRYLPTTTHRRMTTIDKEIQALLMAIINKRKKAMMVGEVLNNDLLGILLESNQKEIQENGNNKNVGMSDQEVLEECNAFYLGGQESTSSFLLWTMVLLSRYPNWQARAREEVLQVFGNQIPNNDGINHLKIVTMILYEVLRLYPPLIYFNRVTAKDVKVGNLFLPAGVQISLPILLIHHNRDIWGDDATEFNPERFSEGVAKATKGKVSFFPFGSGPRVCIGQNFALLEAKIILSHLLQRFSFELSPTYVHAPTTVFTLNPKHRVPIIFQKL